jgi:hypothetical protein
MRLIPTIHRALLGSMLLCGALAGPAAAGVPTSITHQGRLFDAANLPVDGSSTTLTSLPNDHATCPYGGTQLTTGATTTYVCNGAPGVFDAGHVHLRRLDHRFSDGQARRVEYRPRAHLHPVLRRLSAGVIAIELKVGRTPLLNTNTVVLKPQALSPEEAPKRGAADRDRVVEQRRDAA